MTIVESSILATIKTTIVRPSTSYEVPKTPQRPTTPGSTAESENPKQSIISSLLHIVTVTNDLGKMTQKICELQINDVKSENITEIIELYQDSPVEFSIWSKENGILWGRLINAFEKNILKTRNPPRKIKT